MKVRISRWQLLLMIVAVKLSQLTTYAPNLIGRIPPSRDAWIGALIAPLPIILLVLAVYALALRFPRYQVYEYAPLILGRWFGQLFNVLVVLYLIHWLGISLRQFSEFFTATLYVQTPVIVFTLMTAAAVLYAAGHGMEVIARTAEFAGAFVIIGSLTLLALLIPLFRPDELLPILAEGLQPVWEHAALTTLIFGEAVWVALFGVPLLADGRAAPKVLLGGLLVGGTVVVSLTLGLIMTVGPELIGRLVFAPHAAARLVDIGRILERGEWVLVPIWLASMFVKLAVLTYGAALGSQVLTGLLRPVPAVLGVGALGIVWSQVYFDDLTGILAFYHPAVYLWHAAPLQVAPLLLLAVAVLRNARAPDQTPLAEEREPRPHGI